VNENDLARLLPVPAERDLPADRKQILQEHLMTEFRQAGQPRTKAGQPRTKAGQPRTKAGQPRTKAGQPRTKAGQPRTKTGQPGTKPRTRRPVLIAGAVLTAAAVAGAAVVGTNVLSAPAAKPPAQALTAKPTKHTEPAKQTAPAQPALKLPNTPAVQLLVKIANAAASQPAPVVKDSDFTYVRSEVPDTTDVITNHDTPGLPGFHEREVWSPVADLCVSGLLIEGGARTVLSPFPVDGKTNKVDRHPPKSEMPNPIKCPSKGIFTDLTYRFLQTMPTQPGALLAFLQARLKGTNEVVGEELNDLIIESVLPPKLAAAMYRVSATQPGTTLLKHATTATGTPGVGIIFDNHRRYREEWVFDPHTLQLIGYGAVDIKTGKAIGGTTIVQRAFVAKAGERP
jgi:hypothetical protein